MVDLCGNREARRTMMSQRDQWHYRERVSLQIAASSFSMSGIWDGAPEHVKGPHRVIFAGTERPGAL